MVSELAKERWMVEDAYAPKVVEFLESKGFSNIVRMPRFSIYDFEAERNGEKVYVEAKSRSPDKQPIFLIREIKILRLKRLKQITGRKVYFVFAWRDKCKLVEIDELFTADLSPFRVYILRSGNTKNARFVFSRALSRKEIDEIAKLRIQGLSVSEIARRMGVSETTVRRYLKKLGLTKPASKSGERVRDGVDIKILPETKMELKKLKNNLGVRSYSDVIEFLINKYYESVRVEV